MSKRLVALMMALAIIITVFTGCETDKSDVSENETVTVYYTTGTEEGKVSDPLVAEKVTLEDGNDAVDTVMEALWAKPTSEQLISPMPEELKAEKWEQNDTKVSVWFSESFLDLTGISKTISVAALVNSLCGLVEVESVTIYVGENALYTDVTDETMLLYDKEADPYERQVKIYLADEQGIFLADYTYVYTVGGEKDIEQYVMSVLLGDDIPEGTVKLIPEGTELNDIYVEDEICTLDLSADFYEGRPETAQEERLLIYSIVNTLTGISGINSVQFRIDGEIIDYYVTIPLNNPLTRNRNIQADVTGQNVSVFMWSDIKQGLEEFTVSVTGEYETTTQLVLAAINGWSTEEGYTNPVPGGAGLYGEVKIEYDQTVLNLNSDFRNSPAGDSATNMQRAMKAIGFAVIRAEVASNAKVLIEGADVIIDGENLSVNIEKSEIGK